MSVAVILCTVPVAEARPLADRLLEARLAACVNILGPVESRYRWQGELESETEHLLVIKTAAERVPELRERLEAWHSYDVPEILELRADSANAAYAQWVLENSR